MVFVTRSFRGCPMARRSMSLVEVGDRFRFFGLRTKDGGSSHTEPHETAEVLGISLTGKIALRVTVHDRDERHHVTSIDYDLFMRMVEEDIWSAIDE